MMIKKFPIILSLLFCCGIICNIFPNLLFAATITVNTDRNPVVYGESFVLTITAKGEVNGQPDFSVLQKDFIIRSRSHSTSIRYINGQGGQSTAWELTLFPKKVGKITIPEMVIGNDKSTAVEIEISKTSPATQASNQNQAIFVEAEIQPDAVYVQQQLIYTQRLFYAQQISSPQLSPANLSAGKAEIISLGKPIQKKIRRNGRQYQVIERRYGIYPTASGKLTFSPVILEGILPTSNQASNGFFGINGQRIRRYSKAIDVIVQAQPSDYQAKHWLPAHDISLHATWSTPKTQVKVGEPVTISLEIMAHGLRAEQLPKLEIQLPKNIKNYSDQAQLENQFDANGIVGVHREKVVLVAAKNGEYTLPKIQLDWWDVVNKTLKTATIKATKFTVTGGTAILTTNDTPVITSTEQNKPLSEQATLKPIQKAENDNIWFYTTIIFFILWILTLLLWQYKHLIISIIKTPPKIPVPKLRVVLKKLQQACQKNNKQAAKKYLLQWGEIYLQQPEITLNQIATMTNENINLAIGQLKESLYAKKSNSWQGKLLWQAIKTHKKSKNHPKKTATLSPLHPI